MLSLSKHGAGLFSNLLVPYRESLEQHGKEMENRKQETGNWKRVNLPVLHFRFSVSCFSFLPCLVPALPG
jgi:hypothetical protein